MVLILASDIDKENWDENIDLFVMPGGRDVFYHRKLQGNRNNKIKQFVAKGKSYLGICAGAYYASSYVEFDKSNSLEVLEKRELSFYPYKTIGPAYGANSFCYQNHKTAKASLVSINTENLNTNAYIYHNGGCYFPTIDENISVLAKYQDLKDNPAAIIKCNFEKGTIILSAIHIEYGVNMPFFSYMPTYIQSLLRNSETTRHTLFTEILKKLIT